MASAMWQATETLFMTIRANPAMTRESIQAMAQAVVGGSAWSQNEDAVLGRVAAGDTTDPLETPANQRDKMTGLATFLKQVLREGEITAGQPLEQIRKSLVKRSLARTRINAAESYADIYAALPDHGETAVDVRWEGDIALPANCPMTTAQIHANLRSAKVGELVQARIPLEWVIGDRADTSGQPVVEVGMLPTATESTDQPVTQVPSWKGLRLSAIWPTFLEDAVGKDRIDKAQAIQGKSTYKFLLEFCGDIPLDQITRTHIANLVRNLQRLPSQYIRGEFGRMLKKGSSLSDVIALAKALDQGKPDEEKIPKLMNRTINRHLSLFNLLWEYGGNNGAVDPGLDSPTVKQFLPFDVAEEQEGSLIREKGARDMWEPPELQRLFERPFFVGCRSARDRLTEGVCIPRNALWWGVIIAAHHGMRREEIFQLRVRHVVCDEETGIWHFDLKTDKTLKLKGDKRKDKPSRRLVPLHNNLERLGFLEARVKGRDPDQRLFPEITAANQQGSWGAAPGKRFSDFKDAAGFRAELDFHAFRHSVCTLLHRAGVLQAFSEEFVGHASAARKSTFRVYNKGQTLTALKEAIDKLERSCPIAWCS
ncbi:MAG: site-specific integrase [Beijerinckiaceae bacterium]|nr:site-specific integrase [Beijerinckiaceae bacterium]